MATTPKGFPYPLGTDRVMDGDDVIHSLATAVDVKSGLVAGGNVVIPITAVNTLATVAVTFPVGLFTANPIVVCTQTGAGSAATVPVRFFSANAATPSGVTIAGVNTGSAATFNVNWVAQQSG